MRIGLYKVYFITDQEEFSRLVNRYNIKAILFTDYKAVKEESERLVRFCEKEKVRMLLLPSLDELKGGKLKMRALPAVSYTHLSVQHARKRSRMAPFRLCIVSVQ